MMPFSSALETDIQSALCLSPLIRLSQVEVSGARVPHDDFVEGKGQVLVVGDVNAVSLRRAPRVRTSTKQRWKPLPTPIMRSVAC